MRSSKPFVEGTGKQAHTKNLKDLVRLAWGDQELQKRPHVSRIGLGEQNLSEDERTPPRVRLDS